MQNLHDSRIKQKHFAESNVGQLCITNATWQDAADYTCTVLSSSQVLLLTKHYGVEIYGTVRFIFRYSFFKHACIGPPPPPLNLHADVKCSSKQVLVEWKPPEYFRRRPVAEYKVSVTLYDKLVNVTHISTSTLQGTRANFHLPELCPDPCQTFLAVDVQAVNTYGKSPFLRYLIRYCIAVKLIFYPECSNATAPFTTKRQEV